MFERNDDLGFHGTVSPNMSFNQYALKTFTMMALGLLVTTISAFVFYFSGLAIRITLQFSFFPMVLLFAQLGVVLAFSARLFKASIAGVKRMFFAYSILTGITFSTLALIYTATNIALAFGISTIYFGALVMIGYTTKMNLMRFGPILTTSLILLLIFNFIGFMFKIDGFMMIMSSVGLLLFTGITVYDVQKMKKLYYQYEDDSDMLSRLSMYSALDLYLDFINIFLYILRLLSNRD